MLDIISNVISNFTEKSGGEEKTMQVMGNAKFANSSLAQGTDLLKTARNMEIGAMADHEWIGTTGIPTISATTGGGIASSSIEGMTSGNGSAVEDEFNSTLAEYSTIYKTFMQEMITKINAKKGISKYFGTNVTSDPTSGTIYYISEHGTKHVYSTPAWNSRDASCSALQTKLVTASELSQFTEGPPMGSGQLCGGEGSNLRNKTSGEISWVDSSGTRHSYPSVEIWNGRDESCKSAYKDVSSATFANIPSGSEMTTTTKCSILDVDPVIWAKLVEMNKKLVLLAKDLASELVSVKEQDSVASKEMEERRANIEAELLALDGEKLELMKFKENYETVNGSMEVSTEQLAFHKKMYIVWSILALLIAVVTIHSAATKKATIPALAVILIAGLIMGWKGVNWIRSL